MTYQLHTGIPKTRGRRVYPLPKCGCGNVAVIRKWGSWACARCLELEARLDRYHPSRERKGRKVA